MEVYNVTQGHEWHRRAPEATPASNVTEQTDFWAHGPETTMILTLLPNDKQASNPESRRAFPSSDGGALMLFESLDPPSVDRPPRRSLPHLSKEPGDTSSSGFNLLLSTHTPWLP